MKIAHRFKKKSLCLAAILCASLGFVFPAHANTFLSYLFDLNSNQLTDLGTLGGNSAFAHGINDTGQVVGESKLDSMGANRHAFITGPNGIGMTDLGTLGGGLSSGNAQVARSIMPSPLGPVRKG
jgi:probable HAF family extracellular repeat protein